MRDEGDEEMKDFFNEIAVWQQPSAFLDGCALEWVRMQRMRENARGENVVQAEEDNRRDVEIPEEDRVLPEDQKD